MKRMPETAFFSITMPVAGERNVTLRCASPVRSSAAICSSDTSQLRSLVRLDSASCDIPVRLSAPASLSAFTPRAAMAYSRCAATSSGL